MLHAVAHVGLHFALVVNPIHAELVDTVGDAEALNELYLFKLGVLVVLLLDSGEHFFNGLMVLRLIGKTKFNLV